MSDKQFNLAWVTVSDLKKAENFFVNKLGLNLRNKTEEMGWMELQGEDGAYLGVASPTAEKKEGGEEGPTKAGDNAVVTFTVKDIAKTREEFQNKGIKLLGEVMEIPGHVKLQTFADDDNNIYQLVEMLEG